MPKQKGKPELHSLSSKSSASPLTPVKRHLAQPGTPAATDRINNPHLTPRAEETRRDHENAAMFGLNALVANIAPLFIATSPITSYADQIYSIHKTRSSAGFSLDIPLIMLVASILK